MTDKITYFDLKHATLIKNGHSHDEASLEAIDAYLAGKPLRSKKHDKASKNELFWSSQFLWDLSNEVFSSYSFALALSRYFRQSSTSNFVLIEHIAKSSSSSLCKSIRLSEIVLTPDSEKWLEIRKLADSVPGELTELVKICEAFQVAHQQRLDLLAKYQEPFKDLTIFELLSYSSLHAFKGFVEPFYSLDGEVLSANNKLNSLTNILEWKLSISEPSSFNITEMTIGKSLKAHLSPIVFPSNEDSRIPDTLLHQFTKLVQAQVEVDEFLSRSVVPFCFNDENNYFLNGARLASKSLNNSSSSSWTLNGKKIAFLDGYWFNRGIYEFANLRMAEKQIGSKANHQANQIAYIKALSSSLQLKSIYGIGETISTENGLDVDIFLALLSLELMIAFYNQEYIKVFFSEYQNTKHWQYALGMLAMRGFLDNRNNDSQNRLPLTWLDWKQKAKNIVGWTVSDTFPNGNLKAAEAILDFWSLDFKKWSIALKNNNTHRFPKLTERPIFKLGKYSVQLPWMMATQLTGVNTINNLRRFANERSEIKSETTRIEERLGESFKKRGFKVLTSYEPSNYANAGEIDLICKLDDVVLVIEVKSTYRRNSVREALQYKNNALRKAGLQIKRKTEAIADLLETNEQFRSLLDIRNASHCKLIGWIADTSLEFDHEYFSGFLKLSIEELHIALNDDAELLIDIEKIGLEDKFKGNVASLYENGFSAESFVNAIEQSKIWKSANL
ncbi:hypothetical protein [Glaciecola sp. MF2-115]|uniref:hypothetical protein n=1 Tax=Glaciecola sp. MF2-115 TaxID=3384827 RepID=UPI0039A379E5